MSMHKVNTCVCVRIKLLCRYQALFVPEMSRVPEMVGEAWCEVSNPLINLVKPCAVCCQGQILTPHDERVLFDS